MTKRRKSANIQDHTTLLITADQVGLLDENPQLARFLQPAIMVIEDADLIARARQRMRGPCEESLLNRLLNEMDGLREDAMILFILWEPVRFWVRDDGFHVTGREQDFVAAQYPK